MIPGLNKKDIEMLGALVPKVQTITGGKMPSCRGCVREGESDTGCGTCSRHPDLTDNFKRRKS